MLPTRARIGRYEVLALIGVGGMGEVLRARDERLGREVALKKLPESHKLDPDRKALFEREARLLAGLSHPNIAMLHGIEEADDTQALVLELVEGQTLAERLEAGPLPLREALENARQVAAALEAAHERGIVHRDLKPSNLKVRPDGTVKLLDFGLAKTFAPEAADAKGIHVAETMLDLGAGRSPVIGTPAYMSPEQARGDAVDRRTDIWAFGCVLYEMLTGQRAFSGDRAADVLARVLEREPDYGALPAETPLAVRRLLGRCLQKNPNRRLRDIGDARADLDDRLDDGTKRVRTPPAAARRALRWAAVAAAPLAVLALALGAMRLGRPPVLEHRQFVLVPPNGTSLLARTPPFALSPDGKRLVFGAMDAAGRSALWLQDLNAIDARPLAGTEGASDPFWSPDGRAIGFFADSTLMTLSLAGGAPKAVTKVPEQIAMAGGTSAGATWSRAGVIVFAPSPKSPLYRVSAEGGAPVAVSKLEPGDVGHVRPRFLPDGRHFLYLVTAEMPARRGIHVASLDSSATEQVLSTVVKAVYAPPSYLLFVRDGELRARAFDAPTRTWLSAEERRVARSVDHVTTEGRASFDAAANGTLVYRESGLFAANQLTIVDLHGSTIARPGAPGDYQSIAASPDGSQLAVEKHDPRTATGDLWLIDAASGATRQLTFDGLHHNAAVWSPTSAELAITGRPGGVRNVHLFDVSSGVHEPLLPSGPDRNPTDWSRDGRYIVYEENAPGTNFDLWVLEMPNRAPMPLLRESFNERSGRLSPDGRFIAYVSDRTGRPEVYVRPFAAAGATGDEKRVSVTGGLAPRWNADGDRLFFYALDGAVVAVEVATSGAFGAGQPTQLFAADMRFACGSAALLRCPAPPVSWEVLGDGRFLLNASPSGAAPPTPPIRVVENWTSLLTRGETQP